MVLISCHFSTLRPVRPEEVFRFHITLLLMAVSQSCVLTVLSEIISSIRNKQISTVLKESYRFLFLPVSTYYGNRANDWSSSELDDNIKTSYDESGPSIYNEVDMQEDQSILQFSPNVMSLFLETHFSPASRYLTVMSPHVNYRKLKLHRVWCQEAIETNKNYDESNDNPGVIASMLGLGFGDTQRDVSLAKLEYHIFPYKIKESGVLDSPSSTAESDLVVSEGIFSHQRKIYTEVGNGIVTHIAVDDVLDLLEVLSSGVSVTVCYIVRTECMSNNTFLLHDLCKDNDTLPLNNCESIPHLFDAISRLMDKQYNNLRYESDWKALLDHLLVKSGLLDELTNNAKKTAILNYFDNVHTAVIAILQSLSPIRFAFMDGQSRITSLFYFARKIVPCNDGPCIPLLEASGLTLQKISQCWSLAATGNLAECAIHLPPADHFGTSVSRLFVTKMRKLSRQYCYIQSERFVDLKSITPTTLTDAIIAMIEESPASRHNASVDTIWEKMEHSFRHILQTIHHFDVLLQQKLLGPKTVFPTMIDLDDTDFAEEYLKKIGIAQKKIGMAQKKIMFPSLKQDAGLRLEVDEIKVLILVLATALVDQQSMESLYDCINNNWISSTDQPSACSPLALNHYHKGTFVSSSAKDDAWFYPKLYLVSHTSWLQQDIIKLTHLALHAAASHTS
jgi:hypothetical protein